MDLKQIKQIIDLMKRSDLTEFAIEEQGFKLKICRGSDGLPVVSRTPVLAAQPLVTPLAMPGAAPAAPIQTTSPSPTAPAGAPPQEEPGVTYIKSPMVGTFYRAASPEGPPFAEMNAKVEEKTVVCIIEAMKIMNEIQAETKGTIVEILAENGQPVEYGQRLFKVKVD